MEKDPDKVETGPGPFGALIDLMVDDARAKVQEQESQPSRIEGSLAGLDMCAEMRDRDAVDFELAVMQMRVQDRELKDKYDARHISFDDYWRQRCATIYLELCYDVVRTAHFARHGKFPDSYGDDPAPGAVSLYNELAPQLGLNSYVY